MGNLSISGGGNWWDQAMFAALRLGIAPDQFWKMTLKELNAILFISQSANNDRYMKKSTLSDLMRNYPDRKTKQ